MLWEVYFQLSKLGVNRWSGIIRRRGYKRSAIVCGKLANVLDTAYERKKDKGAQDASS